MSAIATAAQIQRVLRECQYVPDDVYPTWRPLVMLFAKLDFNDDDELWQAACAVYAWMPLSLGKEISNMQEFKSLVLNLRACVGRYTCGKTDFDPAKGEAARAMLSQHSHLLSSIQSFNGKGRSVVGTSKFLHFLAPHVMPILDSRVAKSLNMRHSDCETYIEYIEALHRVLMSNTSIPAAVADALYRSAGFSVPRVRQIEFCLYSAGTKESNN